MTKIVELRQLEYFLAVVDCGGLNRAAQQLDLAQPTISQAIRSLERELKVPLFLRTGRNLVPSPTGTLLVPHARRILDDTVAARDAMSRAQSLDEGSVGIVTMPEMSSDAVAAWTARFTRRHPRVRLDISEVRGPRELAEEISSGRAELGFTTLPIVGDGLAFVEFGVQRLLLVRPPGVPATSDPEAEEVPLRSVDDLPLVVSQAASRENDTVARTLREHEIEFRTRATVPNRHAQLTFVLRSDVQAFLPLRMALDALDLGAEVIATDPTITTPFGVVHRPGSLGPAAEHLVTETGRELRRWYAAIARHQDAGAGLVRAALQARHEAAGAATDRP